jgi:hypothetical protein
VDELSRLAEAWRKFHHAVPLEGPGRAASRRPTREGETFVEIDTQSWLTDLQRRLPEGWGAWKGIYPDFETFAASTPLWQAGDGNCCPTAGRADLTLGLRNGRLVIRELEIVRGAQAADDTR